MSADHYDDVPPPEHPFAAETHPEFEPVDFDVTDDYDVAQNGSAADKPVYMASDTASPYPIGAALDDLVDKAVRKRLSAEADTIAAAKFEEVLTPELHTALAEAAEKKIATAIAREVAEAEQAERAAQGPYYRNCYRFFSEFLAPTYRRRVIDSQTNRWCPEWTKHPEARNRIEALWRTWEYLRLDPTTGLSVWWKDHADHHMAYLFSPEGTFRDCSPTDGHQPLPALPSAEIPPILLDFVPGDPPVGTGPASSAPTPKD